MSGIYIHIPFCKQACHYCDFHFSTSSKNKDAFISALKKEISLQKNYLDNEIISTIYFGGGTPSLLKYDDLMVIVDELHKFHIIDEKAEITLEANPDDLTIRQIKELQKTPINRLSIGIQSFYDEELKWMNRAHNSKQATESVKIAQGEGFENISIDLIYGIPSLTNDKWTKNIDLAISLNIQHISAYCLTIEPRTALADFIKKGKAKNIDETQGSEHFKLLMDKLSDSNFLQYEISNFCKEGFVSKHNSSYWQRKNYLGLGPSAHSYNGKSRQWNVSNNIKYIQSLEINQLQFEKETLSIADNYNEYIMTSLRTMWGCDLNFIKNNFSEEFMLHAIKEVQQYIYSDAVVNTNNILTLTQKGKLLADKIASDLFLITKPPIS